MDFQTLARRELQALCKLNKIPANITNVAMVEALSSLDIVVGIEDFLKPSESSETTESSVESPARTEIMSPRVPRTGYRTSTRQKPVREEADAVQTVTRTTRRGVRRPVAGEVEDSKTAAVPETPAAVSTRRRATARKNMETQLNESKADVKVEESMDQEKKSVSVTPAAVMPSSRRKGTAASTTRRVNVKEESMFGKTYSTRRSARLAEVKVEEVDKECEKLEKIDSLCTQSFEEMLDDEGSDGLNAVAEDSSLSVGIESKSELLEVEKEKTSGVDTDMGTEDTMAVDVKNDVLESKVSTNMEVDVIPSDIQNPSELNKLETVENPERDTASEETITEVITETVDSDDTVSVNEDPSEDSKLETVGELITHEVIDSVDVAAAELENEVLDNKGEDAYPPATENPSDTFEHENVGTFEGIGTEEASDIENSSETIEGIGTEEESDIENSSETIEGIGTEEESDIENSSETIEGIDTEEESDIENSSETIEQENVRTFEDMSSDEKTDTVMENVVLENNVENLNELEETNSPLSEVSIVDGVLNSSESEVESKDLEKGDFFAQDENKEEFEFPILSPIEDIEIGFANVSVDGSDDNTKVPSSKTTPLKKSAAKTPSQSRKMAFVSDDKENIDQSGTKLQLAKDVETKSKKSKALEEASLRQLTKMLREKLQINNNADETNNMTKVAKTTRPALQTLSSNSLAATETQGN